MANTKITGLTANTSPLSTDLLVMVDDPAGTPLTQKIAISDLMSLFANPVTDDGKALGTTSLKWSDLFFASGAVINFNSGDVTLTHSTDALTIGGGSLVLAAGTATVAPLNLQNTGTVKTTAANGDIECDGTNLFACVDTGNRGIVPVEHFIRQTSTYTLTNTGSVQKLFDAVTNGTLTLEAGSYCFETLVSISSMSASSGNAAFSFAGTASLSGILMLVTGADAALATAVTQTGSAATTASPFPASMLTAATATVMTFLVKGTFSVGIAGTIIPSIALVTGASAVVAIGSYFKCHRLGASVTTNVGQWS